ncbi:MAG: prepilin-type N-terminal cleavage/methylation domain-containing protein [Blastocatellia bacterium]
MGVIRQCRHDGGFTVVELAIVITIILIIVAISVPGYQRVILHAHEDTLREDLRVMRKMIDQYTADREKAPQTLEDLVEARYLPEVPVDPMTGSAETWEVILEDVNAIAISGDRGIIDVKSGSNEVDATGERRYSDW